MPVPRDFHMTSTKGVGPEFLGRVKLGSSIASLVGVWIFQSFLKETKISAVLLWTALASVPLGLTQVSIYCKIYCVRLLVSVQGSQRIAYSERCLMLTLRS